MNSSADMLSLLTRANCHYTMRLGLSETAGSLFLLGMESLSTLLIHAILSLKMSILLWIF
jgi:hypothetical protein